MTDEKRHGAVVSGPIVLTALVFGLAALAVVMAGLTIPVAGTDIVTDPREIFTTLGAALTGPVGGLIIGVLAGIREPNNAQQASLLAHVPGCLWVGWSYRILVYDRLKMPALLPGWAGMVLIYYFAFLVPGFVIGTHLFQPERYTETYGATASLWSAWRELARGALPEATLTTAFTTLVILALPRKRRRPLW